MKVIIKTYGNDVKMFTERLFGEGGGHVDVIAFTDNDINKIGMKVDVNGKECPIIYIFDALKIYKQDKDIKFLLVSGQVPPIWLRARASELMNIGVNIEDIFVVPIEFVMGETNKLKLIPYSQYSYLQHVEFHLTNRCNLNCKGCGHFMPIIPSDDEINYEDLKKDLVQLKKRVGHVHNLIILGGEPLLSKNLFDCIDWCRKLFPFSNLQVVTNGLLITRWTDENIALVKRNNVQILISQYASCASLYGEIFDFCKEKKLNILKGHLTGWFKKSLLPKDKGVSYPAKNNLFGVGCNCNFLWDGRIFACPMIALVNYFNSYFGKDYPYNKTDGINLYEEDEINWYDFLNTPREICNYCGVYMQSDSVCQSFDERHGFFKHQVNVKPNLEDWIKE